MTTDPSPGQDEPDAGPLDRERARRNPEEAVDALEKQVLGGPEHRLDGGYPDDLSPAEQNDVDYDPADDHPHPGDPSPPTEAAFALDVDPEDQGSPDVAPRNPD